MSDRTTRDRDRFGTPVNVDPDRHELTGVDQAVEDPRGDVGPEATVDGIEEKESKGPIVRFLESFLDMAEPKEKPIRIQLSGDEQAHRIVSDSALVALGAAFDRLIEELPDRVEIAPSGAISAESTTVDTSPRQIIGRNPDRLRVRIRNRSGNIVTLGVDRSVTDGNGYTLEDNDEIELATSAPVYAVADTDESTIKILSEFAI